MSDRPWRERGGNWRRGGKGWKDVGKCAAVHLGIEAAEKISLTGEREGQITGVTAF